MVELGMLRQKKITNLGLYHKAMILLLLSVWKGKVIEQGYSEAGGDPKRL